MHVLFAAVASGAVAGWASVTGRDRTSQIEGYDAAAVGGLPYVVAGDVGSHGLRADSRGGGAGN